MSPRPLHGRRIVITRPEEDAERLAGRLEALGAVPVLAPAIDIEFTDPPELEAAVAAVAQYDWVVFTSRNGVEAVFRKVDQLRGPKVAAIGPATAAQLRSRGVEPDLVPEEFVAEAVVEALGEVRGQRILLPRADIAREALPDGLRAKGAQVDVVVAYRTASRPPVDLDLAEVDAITFTSSSTVRGFLEGASVPPAVKVICIGPITARTARELGLTVHAVADHYTEDGLVEALLAAFATQE